MYTLIIILGFTIFFIIFLPLLISIIKSRIEISQCEEDISDAEYQNDFSSPNFKSFEEYFQTKIQVSLKRLYLNQIDNIKITDTDIIIRTDKNEDLFVAFFYPMNKKYFEYSWDKLKNMFTIATDGQGNEYFINPKENVLKLYFFEHETETIEIVADNLDGLTLKIT